jgi:hypothetical protein
MVKKSTQFCPLAIHECNSTNTSVNTWSQHRTVWLHLSSYRNKIWKPGLNLILMKLTAQKAKPEASTRPVSGPQVQQDREKVEGKTGLHGEVHNLVPWLLCQWVPE